MAELNRLIHEPVRLRVMASLSALGPGEQIGFATLRDVLGLSDGNLGAHLGKLEAARYVRIEKTFLGRKPQTLISLTARGRAAFDDHVAALKELLP